MYVKFSASPALARLTWFLSQAGFTIHETYAEHDDPISCLAWSPDDSILLTAAECALKMFNTKVTPNLLQIISPAYRIVSHSDCDLHRDSLEARVRHWSCRLAT